ncbi:MAG TPA: MBL fold metallo-hydrolase [Methanoculleus sp.]|nr:MBL fold metallo-hydrolase [Methanoculleus sp.]
MNRYSFISQVPTSPGSLQRGVSIITDHHGNINRIHYDRKIDPHTVFFEVTATEDGFARIREELAAIGYLQTSITPLSTLTFHVFLPHEPGALDTFLTYIAGAGAVIGKIAFDDTGSHPDRVTVTIIVEESGPADELLGMLTARYPMEVIEYDRTGEHLDDTVFYLRFAQKMRTLIGRDDDEFLLAFMADINHTAHELTNLGEDPKAVFRNVLEAGEYIRETCGDGFYADVQQFEASEEVTIYAFQLPGGGNIYLFRTLDGLVMLDTGYAVYHPDVMRMLPAYGLNLHEGLSRIIISHGDADHCGAGGFFDVPALMHPATLAIIRSGNRAWGSVNESLVLEEVYTTMIALYSRWHPPAEENISLLPKESEVKRSIFPVLGTTTIGDLTFEILLSLGGHQVGQTILWCPEKGYLFPADSLMNFSSLTPERRRYNSYADYLVTSVNVDSDLARTERKALFAMAQEYERDCGEPCTIFGGHGAISFYATGTMEIAGEMEHYTHRDGRGAPASPGGEER